MKTDSLFHRIFRTAPGIFFELIGQTPGASYRFQSIEVKQTAFRIDGVFLPPDDAPQHPVYFLETQFQPDPHLYRRLFAEVFIYLDQHTMVQDWQAVVIYPKRSMEPGDTHLYRALLGSSQVHRIYLDEMVISANASVGVGLLKLVVEPEKSAAQQAKQLLGQVQRGVSNFDSGLLIELIETTMVYKFPRMSRQEIAEMLGLIELQETRVYQEAREEGRQEGRQEGQVNEAKSLILKLLTRKVGTVSSKIQAQVDALSLEQLEALGEALLDFSSVADLTDWLEQL